MHAPDARNPIEAAVAPEQLVTSHSGHGDLEARFGGRLGHEVGIDAVDGRLVQGTHGVGDPLADLLDADGDLAVLRPVELRGLAREPRLVERRVVECEGDGADRRLVHLGHQPQERRGIDASRQEGAHRHVGHHVVAHRLDQSRAQRGGGLDRLHRLGVPELVLEAEVGGRALDGAPDHPQPGARRQQPDGAVERSRCSDGAPHQIRRQGLRIDAAVRHHPAQRLHLRGEGQPPAVIGHVEGLDPERVSREQGLAALVVVKGEGEHAPQPVEEPQAPLAVAVEQHLGVARRAEAIPARLELAPQSAEVVDLAVVDHPDPTVVRRHRLPAERREIDDRQPAMAESDAPVLGEPEPLVVGSAVALRVAQDAHILLSHRFGLSIDDETCDSAHGGGA